jgi:hypothetical protein
MLFYTDTITPRLSNNKVRIGKVHEVLLESKGVRRMKQDSEMAL